MTEIPDGELLQEKISQWSQGDYALGDHAMLWGYHPGRPLTYISKDLSQTDESEDLQRSGDTNFSIDMSIAGETVKGLALVSQTCDIVRSYKERPYVQVAPLVEMPSDEAERAVQRRSQPRYAFLPALAGSKVVVELDRIFTVEKCFLAIWDRKQGCSTDEQRRSLTESLRRYYTRPAFPNAFVKGISGLKSWFQEKHDGTTPSFRKGKQTPFYPGKCLRALEMTIVRAVPSWQADSFTVDFIFVRKLLDDGIPASEWAEFIETCKDKVSLPTKISIKWCELPLCNLPAKLYLESDIIDFDYLSDGTRNS